MTKFAFASLSIAAALAAACNNNKPSKGSSAKGSDAKGAGQKLGGTAKNDQNDATDQGDTYESVTCDDSEEGVAWCDDDSTIAFCSGGTWFTLDCGSIGGDFCAEQDDTVDCYVVQ
jgi:hypothetical protein